MVACNTGLRNTIPKRACVTGCLSWGRPLSRATAKHIALSAWTRVQNRHVGQCNTAASIPCKCECGTPLSRARSSRRCRDCTSACCAAAVDAVGKAPSSPKAAFSWGCRQTVGSYIVSSKFNKLKHSCAAVGMASPLPSAQTCIWSHPKTTYSAPVAGRGRPGVEVGLRFCLHFQRLHLSLRAAKV